MKKKKKRVHLYNDGGIVEEQPVEGDTKTLSDKIGIGTSIASGVSGIMSSAVNLANAGQAKAQELDNAVGATLGQQYNSSNTLDDLLNQSNYSLMGKVSYKDFMNSAGSNAMAALSSGISGASAGSSMGPWGAVAGAGAGLLGGIFGAIGQRRKAKKLAAEYNDRIKVANAAATNNYNTALQNAEDNMFNQNMASYYSQGGPLTMRYTGTMSPFGNTFAKGGKIHIKPSKRGTFTAAAKKHGKSVQAFASQVLANKENYSPAMVKKANFARNASKWHANGGFLDNVYGGVFSNGVTTVNEGGTHEENPMEGVQMGMDIQGVPNLVEEGEVIFNDYVFSDRMKVPNSTRERLGLSKKDKNLTFAKAAKKLSKESEERPNDPISKNGLEHSLGILSYIQEDERLKKQMRDPEFRQQIMNQLAAQEQQYAHGGRLGKKYKGSGEYSNVLDTPDNTEPYAFWGNQGRNRVTNPRIAEGWNSFTWNNQPLYDTESGRYNPLYTDIRFQNYVRQNYDQLSKDWWNESNAPDYYRAGNTSAPTIDQMLGNDITSTGLMYDKKYGEAHRFGQYALEQYMKSLNKVPQLDPTKSIAMSPTDIKPLDLPELPTEEESKRYPTWMRYTPVAAAGVGILTDALGWTNKPDYSNADAILNATNEAGSYTPVEFNPLGDYLTYRPFDRNYYINKLNAHSGATRRAIVNTSNGNRASAISGLLAADYNAQGKLGDLARQAEEYNLDQREKVATFNRDTNQFNSDMGLKAAMANQDALANLRNYRLEGTLKAAQMRENAKRLADANRAANLTNFAQGLGDIGSENVGWNQMQWAIEHGAFGPMQDRISKDYRRKNGGKLLTKRK